jgi:hypothetical protein
MPVSTFTVSAIFGKILDFISLGRKDTGGKFQEMSNLILGRDFFKLNASIAQMAKKHIAQFPIIVSSAIPEDQVFRLAEISERTIADMLLLCVQNSGNLIDLSKDSDAKRKFIEKYTQGGRSSIDHDEIGQGPMTRFSGSLESAGLNLKAEQLRRYGSKLLNTEESPISSSFEKSLLSDPTSSVELFEDGFKIGAVAPVSRPLGEGSSEEDWEDASEAKAVKAPHISPVVSPTPASPASSPSSSAGSSPSSSAGRRSSSSSSRSPASPKVNKAFEAKIRKIENKQFSTQPTIVAIDVLLQTATNTNKTEVAFGVKTNVHILDSEKLVEATKDTFSDSSILTRVVRWRSGELSFVKDVLLNIKEIKKTVKARTGKFSLSDPRGIFASMRFNVTSSITTKDGKILPTVLLALTTDDVEAIKASCGKDILKRVAHARELCDKLALFGILIVDTANESCFSFFNDGASTFNKFGLKDSQKGKDDGVVKAIFGALKR